MKSKYNNPISTQPQGWNVLNGKNIMKHALYFFLLWTVSMAHSVAASEDETCTHQEAFFHDVSVADNGVCFKRPNRDTKTLYEEGKKAYTKGDCENAETLLSAAAEDEDFSAMQFLASILYTGDLKKCFTKDAKQSLFWRKKLIDTYQNPESMYIFAIEVYKGKNIKTYRELIKRAVELGYDHAKYEYALLLIEDRYCEESQKEAIYEKNLPEWLEKKSYKWEYLKELTKTLPYWGLLLAPHPQNQGRRFRGVLIVWQFIRNLAPIASVPIAFYQVQLKKDEDKAKELDNLFQEGEKKIIDLLEGAGNAGNKDAWIKLAELYKTGKCVDKDDDKVAFYCGKVGYNQIENNVCNIKDIAIKLDDWEQTYNRKHASVERLTDSKDKRQEDPFKNEL